MSYASRDQAIVERILRAVIDRAEPLHLKNALADALFSGGARVRPLLCLAVARAARRHDLSLDKAAACAAAIELIHCASLVHDDLPCFDNADTRRGLPTVHRRHGEATALLVGDALIIAAFETLALAEASPATVGVLAKAAGGSGGLASGQALELAPARSVLDYHQAKTAGLFEAATRLGALAVGADDASFGTLGRRVGLFYQLADDAADAFGDPAVLGKPVRQDTRHGRPSAFAGIACAAAASTLRREADDVIASVPRCAGADELRALVTGITHRLIARSISTTMGVATNVVRGAEARRAE
jgi:geranylgeranyl diphosphate synthase type II